MRKQSEAMSIPPVFQVPPVAAIDTFLHHRSGCKKASTYGKMNLPSVAAVNVVGTTLTLKYLHCYNTVSVFWMFLTKISKLSKLTKFPIFSGL